MLCPDCGKDCPESAKSCPYCGRSLKNPKTAKGGALAVKILLVILALTLVGGAAYAMATQFKGEPDTVPEYDFTLKWVPMDFALYGLKLDIPGSGWSLYYDAETQVVFRDSVHGKLELNFLGPMALNPDAHRIDNNPQVYTIISQETMTLKGLTGKAKYTVVSCQQDGKLVNKHQVYFSRVYTSGNKPPQNFIYFITLDCSAGLESQYAPVFRHIIESLELYE